MQKNFTYKVLDSISSIKKPDWEAIFGNIPQGYDFYKTVEESNLGEFSFHYIVIYSGRALVLIAPVFITDFDLGIAEEGLSKIIFQFIRKIFPRFLIAKALFCGSPISENGILGVKQQIKNKGPLIYELINIMDSLCKNKKLSLIIFKDFLRENIHLLDALKTKGFFMAESFPTVKVNLPYSSLEEYFKSLSHNTRKHLRHRIKLARNSSDLEVVVANNIENIIEEAYPLYLNNYYAGKVKFEKLTPDFFINAGKYLKSEAKFFLYYFQKKLIAFNLCLLFGGTLIDEFIGFDYDLSFKYNLYFYSWCYNIEWCLKNGIKHYQVGQTDYYPKIRLGGEIIPLYVYLRHKRPLINIFLKLTAKLLNPVNIDQDLKHYYKDKCLKTASL